MLLLPRERLFRCLAPEGDEFTFIFDEGRDGFNVALFVETAKGFWVKGGCAAFGKVAKGIEKHFNILNVAHRTLICVHAFQMRLRIIGNQRLDNLRHVTKLFECKPQAMNGAGLRCIHLDESLHRS